MYNDYALSQWNKLICHCSINGQRRPKKGDECSLCLYLNKEPVLKKLILIMLRALHEFVKVGTCM